MQMYVHEILYPYYTTIPQRNCPMLQQQSQKMHVAGSHSQVYSENFHNRLSENFQSRIIIFTEVLPWSLTNPQMTSFYLTRLVSSVATGASLVNIRLLHSSASDFYVTVSKKLNASFINT